MVRANERTDRSEDAAYIAAVLSAGCGTVDVGEAERFWAEHSRRRGCDWARLDNVGAHALRAAAAEAGIPAN